MIPIAREGFREIAVATVLLGGGAVIAWLVWWPMGLPIGALWIFVIAFFRDPRRQRVFPPGTLCAPADGTVTEISELNSFQLPCKDSIASASRTSCVSEATLGIQGPAVRIGIFLSLFNVHVNRAPCAGTVRTTAYRKGQFLDARRPDSGTRNESNLLWIDPDPPVPGPVIVRQVAGYVARRIICHAGAGSRLSLGERIGMIKFGSRTELIVPRCPRTEINVKVGDKVRAGLTVLVRVSSESGDRSVLDQARPRAQGLSAQPETDSLMTTRGTRP